MLIINLVQVNRHIKYKDLVIKRELHSFYKRKINLPYETHYFLFGWNSL